VEAEVAAPPVDPGRRRRLVLTAMFVDMLGGGLFGPFELLYGNSVVSLSLPTAGLLIALAAGCAIAVGPLAGYFVDRFGASRIVAGASVLGAVGCFVLLSATAWGFVGGIFLMSAAQRGFYGAWTPFVASVAESRDLEFWFGRIRSARFIGIALGQALSGAVLAIGVTSGLRLIVVLDALTYILAATLLFVASRGVPPETTEEERVSSGGYKAALADRTNVALAGLNVACTLLIIAPIIAMPVYVIQHLHLGTWVPGVLAAINTATLVVGSFGSLKFLRGRRRLRNLALSNCVWALALVIVPGAGHTADVVVAVGILVISFLLLGLGESLYGPTADALPAALAPPALRGRYSALHQIAWGVSETIAPAICGFLLAVHGSLLWFVLAPLGVVTALVYRALEGPVGGRDGVAGEALGGDEPEEDAERESET